MRSCGISETERVIDLHLHTTVSDGSYTPAELVCHAAELGLAAVAVTDHDAVAGCAEAAAVGESLGVEVVPGIEISTKYGGPVHLLGYYVDTASPALREVLDWIVHDRDERNKKIAALMAADGLPVSYEEMHRRFGAVIGRPHFAQVLMELGLASDTADAFARYVEKGRRYYVGRSFLSLERSMEIILEAGGLPVLAHPFQYRLDDAALRALIEHCLALGMRGMECRYSGYTKEQEDYLESLAEEYGLLKTGGSDFHGKSKPTISMGSGKGRLHVPYSFLAELKRAAGRA